VAYNYSILNTHQGQVLDESNNEFKATNDITLVIKRVSLILNELGIRSSLGYQLFCQLLDRVDPFLINCDTLNIADISHEMYDIDSMMEIPMKFPTYIQHRLLKQNSRSLHCI